MDVAPEATPTGRNYQSKLLRSVWKGPIVVKGIQTVDDAVLAADAGVEAIALSRLDHWVTDGQTSKPPATSRQIVSDRSPILYGRPFGARCWSRAP